MLKIPFGTVFTAFVLFGVSFAFCAYQCSAQASTVQGSQNSEELAAIEQIEKLSVDRLSLATPVIIEIMNESAKTNRVYVLNYIIKGLAFNVNPRINDENLSIDELIPAIDILKKHYGSFALPYLYLEGINTKYDWMRERCALAIRTIATKEEIVSMNKAFSLKETSAQNGKVLLKQITQDHLQVKLFDPIEVMGSNIDKALVGRNLNH